MYKTGLTTFVIGSSYSQTAKNVDEKLAQLSKDHGQNLDAESIVHIDYNHRIFFYKYRSLKYND